MLSYPDLILAAVAAFFITWLVLKISSSIKFIPGKSTKRHTTIIKFSPNEFKLVLDRCKNLFPQEMFTYRGKHFKRGMTVKLVTFERQVYHGELIGKNKYEIVCVLTNSLVVADTLDRIEDITDAGKS